MIELAKKKRASNRNHTTKQKGRTNNSFKAKGFGRKKEAHTITAVMERYTLRNGETTLSKVSQITGKIMNLCAKVRQRIKGGAKVVTQLHLINSYNKSMGGVNLMNHFLESYRPTIRGKNGSAPCL